MSEVTYIGEGGILTSSLDISKWMNIEHSKIIEWIKSEADDLKELGSLTFETLEHVDGKSERFLLNFEQGTLLIISMPNNPFVRAFKKNLLKSVFKEISPSVLLSDVGLDLIFDKNQEVLS